MKFLTVFILTLYVIYETVICNKESQVLLSNKEIREILKCFGDLNLEEGCVICRYITQKIYKVLDISAMCPDIVETKLMFEREREWKPDPQVINKWTVLHNLQKDYLQRIKPGLDGIKNYNEILTEKIRKEKQEKENLQNLIQFQNKVNSDLRKGDEIKNNSFDSDDKNCDDEELKYKNNKIIAPDKNHFNNNRKNEIYNLAERNNNNQNNNINNDNNNKINNSNSNSSDKPNLFALNKRIFSELKNNSGSKSDNNKNNNINSDSNNNNSNSNLTPQATELNGNAQNEKKLDQSNVNKLKSAMASFFNKDDKAAFKFSETNTEITNGNLNQNTSEFSSNDVNKKQKGLSIEDAEVMDIDLTNDGAKSSIDFKKIIENIKLNEGDEIQYLGTSIGSPYNNDENNTKYKKIDLAKVNENSEIKNLKADKNSALSKFNSMNKFSKNLKTNSNNNAHINLKISNGSVNSNHQNKSNKRSNQKVDKQKLREQADNLEKKLKVKSIFDQNPIKANANNFFGHKKSNKTETKINKNSNSLNNSTAAIEALKKNINGNNNEKIKENLNSIFKNELDIYAKNIQFKENSMNLNMNGAQPINKDGLANGPEDDLQINYLQTKNENMINNNYNNINNYKNNAAGNSNRMQKQLNNNNNNYIGFYNANGFSNSATTQQQFNPNTGFNNLQNPYQLSEMNRLANANNFGFNNINAQSNNNFNNNFNNQNAFNFPNSVNNQNNNFQQANLNSFTNPQSSYQNGLKPNNQNKFETQNKSGSTSIESELTQNLDLSIDNPLNREIKKRLEKIKKLQTLNAAPAFDEKSIRESESILNNYDNENFNFKNVGERIANPPPTSFLELSESNFDKNLFETLIKKSENYNLETQRRGRRRSRFPDPQWDCAETQIAKLVRYLCEEEVSASYQKYCKPIFEQINTMIESYLYHDNNLEICQNLHMCPVSVDI